MREDSHEDKTEIGARHALMMMKMMMMMMTMMTMMMTMLMILVNVAGMK